jgi:hypothetical protein
MTVDIGVDVGSKGRKDARMGFRVGGGSRLKSRYRDINSRHWNNTIQIQIWQDCKGLYFSLTKITPKS